MLGYAGQIKCKLMSFSFSIVVNSTLCRDKSSSFLKHYDELLAKALHLKDGQLVSHTFDVVSFLLPNTNYVSIAIQLQESTKNLLRIYREENNISTIAHSSLLQKRGWTLEDYEVNLINE